MALSKKAQDILAKIAHENTKMGFLRKIAKDINRDHALALELWSANLFLPRLLATLIMEPKLLTKELVDEQIEDIQAYETNERLQLIDWLMANQLTKDKSTIALMESWENSKSTLQRRVFWYYQARLRWMGKTDQTNTEALLSAIEAKMSDEHEDVQWAMNFTAGQIGKFQEAYRDRCIAIGETTGLYKDEKVMKGCVPSYLPKFIPIEVAKLKK